MSLRAAILAAACLAGAAHAEEFCTETEAFRICQPRTGNTESLLNCIDAQLVACKASYELRNALEASSIESEKARLKACAKPSDGGIDWLKIYSCAFSVVEQRNRRLYVAFLADRDLADPDRIGRFCTTVFIDADEVRGCLGDNKAKFMPLDTGD